MQFFMVLIIQKSNQTSLSLIKIESVVLFRTKFINLRFMKKYVHFAKALKPQLTQEAADIIVEEYTRLRNQDLSQTDNQARVRFSYGYIWI